MWCMYVWCVYMWKPEAVSRVRGSLNEPGSHPFSWLVSSRILPVHPSPLPASQHHWGGTGGGADVTTKPGFERASRMELGPSHQAFYQLNHPQPFVLSV